MFHIHCSHFIIPIFRWPKLAKDLINFIWNEQLYKICLYVNLASEDRSALCVWAVCSLFLAACTSQAASWCLSNCSNVQYDHWALLSLGTCLCDKAHKFLWMLFEWILSETENPLISIPKEDMVIIVECLIFSVIYL